MYDIDFQGTFSLVAKLIYVRLLISFAAIHHYPLHQLDMNNTFLHGVFDKEVYIEQPLDFVAHIESGQVCRLRKSLCWLKRYPIV